MLTPAHTADVELRIPATIQGPKRSESAKGLFWVTDQRVSCLFIPFEQIADRQIVFKADTAAGSKTALPAYDAPPSLDSLNIPYVSRISKRMIEDEMLIIRAC